MNIIKRMKGGELFKHITTEGQLEEGYTQSIMKQVLSGLSFLHSQEIAHLDIKVFFYLLSFSSFKNFFIAKIFITLIIFKEFSKANSLNFFFLCLNLKVFICMYVSLNGRFKLSFGDAFMVKILHTNLTF